MMLKILIVDDHPVVRRGLAQILNDISEKYMTDEAQNGAEAMEKVSANKYDIVLLDISLPDTNGFNILKNLKYRNPDLAVLMLSIYPESMYAIRALKEGANGYLTKESAPDELIKAIQKVAGGGKYVSSSLAEKLAFNLESGQEKPAHESLSEREFQVLTMITSGKKPNEIAQELSLSVKTVSTYRIRIMRKLNLRNNAELIHYAIQNKIIDVKID